MLPAFAVCKHKNDKKVKKIKMWNSQAVIISYSHGDSMVSMSEECC